MYKPLKLFFSVCSICLFLFLSFFLSQRFIVKVYDLLAINQINKKDYSTASDYLKKAATYDHKDYSLWQKLGNTYYNLSSSFPHKEAFDLLQKSKQAYQKAIQLNSLDAESAYGLSLTEARLETLHPIIHYKTKNPYNASPYFDQAIQLRPNSVSYHYTYVRYLYNRRKEDEFLNAISTLVKIYPLAYEYIKKEPFWSAKVNQVVKKGLRKAIDEGVNLYRAHQTLSSILEAESSWKEALYHYELALNYQNHPKTIHTFIQLGSLSLKARQFEKAENNFLKALSKSQEKEKTLNSIFNVYKRSNRAKELYQFYQKLTQKFSIPVEIDILAARSFIDLKQYDRARELLNEINQERPTAEVYYWLAKTAEKEKDWDSMELAIQKATVMEPKNSLYHETFSRVLTRMKKIDRAEKEADLAVKYAEGKASPLLFSHRATIKLRQKKYKAAINDWKSAIELKPDNPRYYINAANIYLKIGEKQDAITYYKKALDLDPNNANYRKRYQELLAE